MNGAPGVAVGVRVGRGEGVWRAAGGCDVALTMSVGKMPDEEVGDEVILSLASGVMMISVLVG